MAIPLGTVFIQIRDGRARVSRYLPFAEGYSTWEEAANAAELEPAARRELEARQIDLRCNRHVRCSQELALQARFEVLTRY